MTNQEILKAKPEGASNVSDNGVYYYSSDGIPMNYWTRGEEWVESGGIYHLTRSIADIEERESLRAQLARAKADGVREFGKWYVDTNDRSVFDVAINDLADLYADSLSKGKDCERD